MVQQNLIFKQKCQTKLFSVWNFSDIVNSIGLTLEQEYFKNIFRLKSEKY